MAKSPKNKIEDAIELDVETSEVETGDEVSVETEGDADVAPAHDVAEDELLDDVLDDDTFETEVDDTATTESFESAQTEPAPSIAEQPQKSGFFPLVLGGVVAGVIGFGIASYLQPEDKSAELAATLSQQADQIAQLQDQFESLPAPDFSGVEAQIADATAQITDLQARFEQVERQPNLDGTLSETALAAYEAELDALRSELDQQQTAVMSAASQAEQDLAAARAEAERLEQEAITAAQAASARAAINRIATAVDTGAPFADALKDLADVPVALQDAAETGVATNAQLTADFPAVARAALATARSEGASDDASGIGGFLRSQFDVRSTTPQEGPGPDAVLSRAEAAIKEGRVSDALAEIETLPEVARAEITDWTAQAQERANVLDAIAGLSETYQ